MILEVRKWGKIRAGLSVCEWVRTEDELFIYVFNNVWKFTVSYLSELCCQWLIGRSRFKIHYLLFLFFSLLFFVLWTEHINSVDWWMLWRVNPHFRIEISLLTSECCASVLYFLCKNHFAFMSKKFCFLKIYLDFKFFFFFFFYLDFKFC